MSPGLITPWVSMIVTVSAPGVALQSLATQVMVLPTTSTSPGSITESGASTTPRNKKPPVPVWSTSGGGEATLPSVGSGPASTVASMLPSVGASMLPSVAESTIASTVPSGPASAGGVPLPPAQPKEARTKASGRCRVDILAV